MRSRYSGRRLAVVFGIAIAGLVLAGSIAYASIPDSSGVLHGCYSANGANAKGGAQLNLVNSDQATCTNGQTAVTWSQTGPAGGTGPTGPTGPAGPAGPTDIWDLNHYGNGSLAIGVNNSTFVAVIAPPAGTYYVEASLHGFNSNGAADIWCELQAPGTIAWAQGDATEANQNVDLHLQGVGTITSSQNINVTCRSNAAGSTVEDWNLDALQVSTVH